MRIGRYTPMFCAGLVLLAATAGNTDGDAPWPDYSHERQSYHVPFARPPDFSHLTGLHVRVSLNGGPPQVFLVDTGSTGVVVSAGDVPHLDPHAPRGEIKYSSSGLEMVGVWTTVTLTFPDSRAPQGRVATAVVPALAVTERLATGSGVNAGQYRSSRISRVHMLGVGFGRGTEPHPERNPFLNLNEMQSGAMRRGYTITRDGITLGLTPANAGPGYVFQKLSPRPGLKDWETPPGSVTVGTHQAPMGTVLMDTGLTNMMIALPGASATGDVPPGTDITVALLGGRLHYSFHVGGPATPTTPRHVSWITPTHGTFVNTGLRALAAFDLLYDADAGYFALRPASRIK